MLSRLFLIRLTAKQLIASLLYVAKSLRATDIDRLPLLAALLHGKATAIIDLTEHLLNALPSPQARGCLQDLLQAIRLIGSGLDEK